MKFILSLLFVILFSYHSYAFNIYKCNSETRIEIAMCGHYSKCKNTETGQTITKKIVHSEPSKYTYTVVTTEEEITIKRDVDGHLMNKFQKKYSRRWRNDIDSIMAIGSFSETFVNLQGNFYYLSGLPSGFIDTGTCKLQ